MHQSLARMYEWSNNTNNNYNTTQAKNGNLSTIPRSCCRCSFSHSVWIVNFETHVNTEYQWYKKCALHFTAIWIRVLIVLNTITASILAWNEENKNDQVWKITTTTSCVRIKTIEMCTFRYIFHEWIANLSMCVCVWRSSAAAAHAIKKLESSIGHLIMAMNWIERKTNWRHSILLGDRNQQKNEIAIEIIEMTGRIVLMRGILIHLWTKFMNWKKKNLHRRREEARREMETDRSVRLCASIRYFVVAQFSN